MRRAAVLSGGFSHDFCHSSLALGALAREGGWDCAIETGVEQTVARLDALDLVILNTLRWSMTQHEKYAAHRAQWAYSLPEGAMAALMGFVERGGGLLAVHTSLISFDSQPGWRTLLGGGWVWGRSHHPPLGVIMVTPLAAPAFTVIDEAYHHLDPAPDCEVVATADTGGGAQPVVWRREVGRGRVAVDALGHDARSIETPGHRALLAGLLEWLGG